MGDGLAIGMLSYPFQGEGGLGGALFVKPDLNFRNSGKRERGGNSLLGFPILFNHRSLQKPAAFPGVWWFSRKKDPWKEWGSYP